MPSSVVGPRSSKALPKAKLAPRKGHSHCLMVCSQPVWSTIAFWILAKPLHLRSTLSNWWDGTENCTACNWHWSTERAQFFSMTMPWLHVTQPTLQKLNTLKKNLNELGYEVLLHPPYLPDLLPTDYQASRFLAGKTLPQPAGGRKCFPRVRQIPKHGFLRYRNKQTYFSLAKTCWL